MIGTIVFVVAFIVIGLTVVLVAMRSGRGPADARREGRGVRRAWGLGIGLVIVVVGIAVPVLVLAVNGSSHAEHAASGVNLTSAEAKGRELFTKNCATCHTLAASSAVGRVGPNLDTLNGGNLTPAFILDAIKNGRARGNGQMPGGLLEGNDAKNVAAYVSTVAGR